MVNNSESHVFKSVSYDDLLIQCIANVTILYNKYELV